jgi:hypothetical protein
MGSTHHSEVKGGFNGIARLLANLNWGVPALERITCKFLNVMEIVRPEENKDLKKKSQVF